MTDPIHALVHDHAEINQRARALAPLIRDLDANDVRVLEAPLRELCDVVFLHFAREEEGLFPFVAETLPELADAVGELATSHDTICGALARMLHIAAAGNDAAAVRSFHERFALAYASHALAEAELLRSLDARLDAAQRSRLAALVEGL